MLLRNRERVARALAHQETDLIPFDAAGCGGVAVSPEWPTTRREYWQRGEFRYLRFDPAVNRERFQPFLPGLPAEAEVSYWGIGRLATQTPEGHHAGHRYWHPLAELDRAADLERYPFPNRTECRPAETLAAEVAAAKHAGFTVVGNMSQTILETAYLLRGMEQLLADFHERPAYIEELFERLAQWRQFQAHSLAMAGVDVLRIGDDIATQQGLLVSVDHYRRFIQPHHAAVIAAARNMNPKIQVLYHSDGNLTRLLPDLIDAGVTAINPVQPECMNVAEIKREFGRQFTLWGCLPSQSLYAHGTPEEIASNLRDLVTILGRGGGLVLQFFNLLITERVKQNVQSFFAAYHDLELVKK